MASGCSRSGATANNDEKESSTISNPDRANKCNAAKRKLRTSPHFAVTITPRRNLRTFQLGQACNNNSSRSRYFVSSPDSSAGSAASFDWGSAFTQSAVDAFRACPEFKHSGVRHLCRQLCYLRAYEVRMLHMKCQLF